MLSFTLTCSEKENIEVVVFGYERPPNGDYHDDNWLNVLVQVNASGFSGKFGATFLTEDFVNFHSQLQTLYAALKGEALFSTLEEQLSIQVTGNGRGGINVQGVALDQPGIGNKLEFAFSLDQTALVPTLRELNEIIATFPIRSA